MHRRLAHAGLLCLGLLFAIVGYANLRELLHAYALRLQDNDLRLYYAAAQVGLKHGWAQLYDAHLQQAAVHALTPHGEWLPFVNPPEVAWLTLPLTALPYPIAYVLCAVAALLLLLVASQLLPVRTHSGRLFNAVALLALTPTYFAVAYANIAALAPIAVLGAWRLLRNNRQTAAGLVLAAGAFKPQLILLVPLALLICGFRRALFVFLAAGGAMAVAALIALGPHGLEQYRQLVALVSSRHDQQFLSPFHTVGGGLAGMLLDLSVVAAVGAIAFLHRRDGAEIPIAGALVGSLLVSPYLNPQDFLILVCASGLVLQTRWRILWPLLLATWFAADGATTSPLFVMIIELGLLGALVAVKAPLSHAWPELFGAATRGGGVASRFMRNLPGPGPTGPSPSPDPPPDLPSPPGPSGPPIDSPAPIRV